MDNDSERWVVISAVIVAGIYAYRRSTETPAATATLKGVAGSGPPVALGAFVTAWGCVFLVISIMASADADLGKAFAILVAAGDLVVNGQDIANDIINKVKPATKTTTPAPAATTTPAASPTVLSPTGVLSGAL